MSVKVGDKLRDNDPRMYGGRRVLEVVGIMFDGTVRARDRAGREFRYSPHRIHTDGKPRKSGLSVVQP